MSFHLLGYSKSQSASSLTSFDPITDPVVTSTSAGFQLAEDRYVLFGYALGATLNRAVIQSPTISANFSPQIRPVNAASVTPSNPGIALFVEGMIRTPKFESLAVQAVNGGSERDYFFLGVTQQVVPAPRGEVRVLRGTSTTTLTANAWTLCTTTWDAVPQNGTYSVVNAEFVSANGVAGRLIFPGQVDRPGGPCATSVSNLPNTYFSQRYLFGEWGRFQPQNMVQAELLAGAADSSATIFLYVVRTA